ncbi:hypothetical protein EHV15_35415 [Paenibacillus oralis]|uniref:Uncharacterized protein n=1 Tax=Paenibacillus oralis TaxID=2490856 RepID=A0A3P3T9Y1_9BACL|nr:hypothetical protein [Paenibacillus oralis]RRJ54865.1 hypothetical protein EHV15_35415 [Paenibacillus oralis]
MKKRYKFLWIALGVFLLFAFNLQIVVPAIYISIGFILYVFFFCWAKAKELDNSYDGWYFVLNTTQGMCYFIISGSLLWMPVLLPFIIEQSEKLKFRKRESNNGFSAWLEYLKNPMKLHRDWFNNFYQ